MTIGWYRDLTIIIFSSIATLALIFIAVLLYLLWRRLEPLLHSMNATAKTMEEISALISSPILRVAPFLSLVASLIEAIVKMFKKDREGGQHG